MKKVKSTKWYQSKTLWFNGITAILLIAEGLGTLDVVPIKLIAVVSLVGNVILRIFVTGSPIDKSIR